MQERQGPEVQELKPEKRVIPLEGLYLAHRLKEVSRKLNRAVVISNYVTDVNDVIATSNASGPPQEIKNPYDWRLFQELTAQADVILTGGEYLNRLAAQKRKAQNVLTQFEPGQDFAELGEWRLKNGYEQRSPDVVVVSRSLNFELPKGIVREDRKVIIFTIYGMLESEQAQKFEAAGARIVGGGKEGVNGRAMVAYLEKKGYGVIKNTTGPSVLKILLDSEVLDRLYVTQVQTEIPISEGSVAIKLLERGKVDELEGFTNKYKYLQEGVHTNDGKVVSQLFLVYDSEKFKKELRHAK